MEINKYIEDNPEISLWWDSVDKDEKSKLMQSWSPESDTCKNTLAEGKWEELPIIIVGRLTDTEENKDWNSDLYEFFVNHPEFFISGLPICFHVCTNEEVIRHALRKGFIPKNFFCSMKTSCLMKPIINALNGKALVFEAYRIKQPPGRLSV